MSTRYTYDDWIKLNRADEDFNKKVIYLAINEIKANDNPIFQALSDKIHKDLFWSISAKNERKESHKIDGSVPVLYYGGSQKWADEWLKNSNATQRSLYNKQKEMLVSGDKRKFQKLFDQHSFMAKTVFSKKDAISKLKFPVIAKPADGHSGIGIQKFNSIKELEKSKDDFDLFSEFVEHKQEFRLSLLKEKIMLVDERVPKIGENSTVATKKKDDELKFVYVSQDLNKVQWLEKAFHLSKIIHNNLPLDIWSLDVLVTNDDELFVIEANSASGLGSVKAGKYYMHIYEDFYDEALPYWFIKHINETYVNPFHKENFKQNPEEIKKSPWRINYETL